MLAALSHDSVARYNENNIAQLMALRSRHAVGFGRLQKRTNAPGIHLSGEWCKQSQCHPFLGTFAETGCGLQAICKELGGTYPAL